MDTRLRDDLATIADEAGPPTFTAEQVAVAIRRRRRRILSIYSVAGALVVGLAAAVIWPGIGADRHGPVAGQTASSQVGRPFVCGDELFLGEGAAASRAGLTMALSTVRYSADVSGPELAVTFTGDRPLEVRGSPTTLFEVLYLREGTIVGGGPMLNEAGNLTPQGLNLVGAGFTVAPGQPYTQDLGRRDRLCGSLTWPDVWSQRERYEVVLIQGQVSEIDGPNHLRLDIPFLGHGPLLVARAKLGG